MPPWSRQQSLQNVSRLLLGARTAWIGDKHDEAVRLLKICAEELDRLFRSCVAARGMYATNAKLRNHISALAPKMLDAQREVEEMIETEISTVNLRQLSTDLGQITFIPAEAKVNG